MIDILHDFMNLYRGSALAHGTFDKSNGNMATILSAATEEDYRRHLVGDLGLGIVPVNEEGKCFFAAIDIDIDTISHTELYEKVQARNMPLTVCRSKSGGAHLLIFFRESQPASLVQNLLRKWAGLLGFPNKTEIFPKQLKSTHDNTGNWINLNYFAASNTVRYAINARGSMDIEEFLGTVQYYTGIEKIDDRITNGLVQIDMMPPCLKAITQEGLPAGHRNEGLFSYGVFYRKSSPNGWEDKLRSFNSNYVSPPLPTREVEALVKSIGQRSYQYKCDSSPCIDHCDRKTCLTLEYGVGHKSYEDEANFDEVSINNLRKILTDPPTYILEVNSRDIYLTSDEFLTFAKIRKRIIETQNSVIRPIKQQQWEQKMKSLLASVTEIEAPDDASILGAINSKVDDYLSLISRFKNEGIEGLLRGLPIAQNGRILFTADGLQKHMISQKVMIANQDLFSMLNRRKCTFETLSILGKQVQTWGISRNLVNLQTENYTDAKFEKREEEI